MIRRNLLSILPLLLLAATGSCDGSPAGVDRAPVAEVDISPTSAQVQLGASQPFAATVRDAAGNPLSGRRVLWASEDTSIARVSQDGTVTAVGMGSTRIAASSEGEDAVATVSVVRRAVAAVRVSPASADLTPGGTVQLTATPVDDAGSPLSGREVTWSSSGPAVASVDADGLVTAVKAGSVTITAAAEGVTGKATVTVSSPTPVVASVRVTPDSVDFTALGGQVRLTATALDATGEAVPGVAFAWTSTSPSVASVDDAGLVVAVSNGTSRVIASAGGRADTSVVTVRQQVARVVVTPAAATVTVGSTARFSARAEDASGATIADASFSWSSSKPSVAIVDGSGVVTGRLAGTATITASSGGRSGSAQVTVNAAPPPPQAPVASVEVTPASRTLEVGGSFDFDATLRAADGTRLEGRQVSWNSSAPSVASVDGNGLVTAKKAGQATITATSEGRSGTAQVTVTDPPPPPPAPVASVEVTPASRALEVGETFDFDAILRAADGTQLQGRQVSWKSSDQSVASVDGTGVVTAKQPGQVTITASSEGKNGTASVTVNEPPPPPPAPVAAVEVTPDSRTLQVGETFDFDAVVRDADGNELQGRTVDWSSSDPSVASVDENGLVTAKQPGQVTITATSEGKNGTATVIVAAPAPAKLEYVSGDDQKAKKGETLDDPLVVRVVDATGSAVAGVQVRWNTDYGSLAPGTSLTDTNGFAQTLWTLGDDKLEKDDPEARATVDALPGQEVVFTARKD